MTEPESWPVSVLPAFLAWLGVALVSALLTGRVRHYALRRLLDVPNARSSHRTPTPRGGGLAIVTAFALSLGGLFLAGLLPLRLLLALSPMLLLAAAGFLDDHGHVPARWRLLAQVLSALWALAWTGAGEGLHFAFPGAWVLNFVMAFFMVWFTNLYNFMDGIDGIAGVETLGVAFSASILLAVAGGGTLPDSGWVLLALAASASGFLAWNWPPARIFMGDVGSGSIGFVLAAVAAWTVARGELGLAPWLILGSVFIVDATYTLLARLLSGQRWYEAHRSHAYQHATQHWGSHRRVTLAVAAIDVCVLLPLALAAVLWPEMAWGFLTVAVLPLVFLSYRLRAGSAAP